MNLDENYLDLANAIVIQAVEDYTESLRTIRVSKSKTKLEKAEKIKNKCEKFFRTEWFFELSRFAIDYDALIETCHKNAQKDKEKNKDKKKRKNKNESKAD